MSFIKHFIIFIFSIIFISKGSAQELQKSIFLKNVLFSIEKQHNLHFNFIENDVDKIALTPPDSNLSLNEKLEYLESKTKLQFDTSQKGIFTIYKRTISQKIKGFIYSEITKLPLENINISTSERSVVSNSKGQFEIEIDDSNQIIITSIGFKTKKIEIKEADFKEVLKIFLEEKIDQLEPINAKPYLTSGISKDTDGKIYIKLKRLGILPGLIEPDVLQTIQQIPSVNSVDESIASLNVRGGTHDQNLFLWNGIKMYQTGHFFGLISVFNPNLANSISFYSNGSSAFYGDCVSSVVDISSDSHQSEKNNFGVGINMINADIYGKINVSKTGFVEIAARRSINDLAPTPTYKQYYNKVFQNTTVTNFSDFQNNNFSSNEKFYFYDFTFKYSQKIGLKSKVVLDLITINDALNLVQSGTINNSSLTENNDLTQKNYGLNLSFKHHWNINNKTNFNFYISNYELFANKNKLESNQRIEQQNLVLEKGIKIENNHQIVKNTYFNWGYQLSEIGTSNLDNITNPSFYKKVNSVLRTHSVIFEGKINDSINRIYLNLGLRTNYVEQFSKTRLEPRFQLNYGLFNDFNVEILGEVKSQNCFQIIDLQNDYFGIEKRRWTLANNSTIPTQESKQISLGFSYNKNNWLMSLTNFYKKVIGVNSSSQGFQNQLEYTKINGQYEAKGLELLVQKKINHFISWLSYSSTQNNYYFDDIQPSQFPNNYKIDHLISWAGVYEQQKLKLALGVKWYNGRPTTTLQNTIVNSDSTLNYNSPNNAVLPDFLQVNCSVIYSWKSLKAFNYKLGISVTNLFNRKNEINEYYRLNSVTNAIENEKSYALNITPNVSFRISY